MLQHSLRDLATGPAGRTGATGTFTLNVGALAAGDEVTLWYQNLAFDYVVSSGGSISCVQAMWWQGNANYNHLVTIGSATYSCLEDSLNSAGIASNIAAQINALDANCTAVVGGAYGNEITISLRAGVSGPVVVSSSDGSAAATLAAFSASNVTTNLANQINQTDWTQHGPVALSAVAKGNQLTITAEPGADGNAVTFYELHASENLSNVAQAIAAARQHAVHVA